MRRVFFSDTGISRIPGLANMFLYLPCQLYSSRVSDALEIGPSDKAPQKNCLFFLEIVLQGSNDNPLEEYEPCRWKILPEVFLGILSAKQMPNI